jgi:replication factor A1
MKLTELRDGMRQVAAEGIITEVSEPRTVNLKAGGNAEVADFRLEDESGFIKLPLWDAQIDDFTKGDRVRITNGYTNSFMGELRLNVGRYGKIEKAS